MTTFTIDAIDGLEVLDSRGRPTLRASCRLRGGALGAASVPSGASRGRAEAIELRDGDPERYLGLGCRRAVACLRGEIASALRGTSPRSQSDLDGRLRQLDGTEDKSRLGANTLLAVSLAYARACAAAQEIPLHEHLASMVGGPVPRRLPRPTINLFSGGEHAGGQVAVQDVLVVPASPRTIDDVLSATFAVYRSAAALARDRYGMRPLTADEGGLAPPFESSEAMLEAAVEAIAAAGRSPGHDVALAVDVASSHFFQGASPGEGDAAGRYRLDGRTLTRDEMVAVVAGWVDRFPLVSVEDALAEEDWDGWPALRRRLAGRALVLGDDLLCTKPERIRRAIASGAADALLLKANQVGTLSEALDALHLARQAGWSVTASARSGETEDDWLADLAVGWGADQIKIGSITQSERLAKYNRLLAIEAATGWPVTAWPGIG